MIYLVNLLSNIINFCLLISLFDYNITTNKYNYKTANAVKIYK